MTVQIAKMTIAAKVSNQCYHHLNIINRNLNK